MKKEHFAACPLCGWNDCRLRMRGVRKGQYYCTECSMWWSWNYHPLKRKGKRD